MSLPGFRSKGRRLSPCTGISVTSLCWLSLGCCKDVNNNAVFTQRRSLGASLKKTNNKME